MNSSEVESRFPAFLRRSLALLARERPDAYRALCLEGGRRTVAVSVDGGTVNVVFGRRRVICLRGERAADVHVTTTRSAILAALDGAATLAELVLDGRLELVGDVDDVLIFHDALTSYVHGAVRARSFSKLLRDFRAEQSTTNEVTA